MFCRFTFLMIVMMLWKRHRQNFCQFSWPRSNLQILEASEWLFDLVFFLTDSCFCPSYISTYFKNYLKYFMFLCKAIFSTLKNTSHFKFKLKQVIQKLTASSSAVLLSFFFAYQKVCLSPKSGQTSMWQLYFVLK